MTPYYSHAGITIYHGDSREVQERLQTVDAVVTDPPYGVELPGYSGFDDSPEYVQTVVLPIIQAARGKSSRMAVTPGVRNMWLYPRPTHTGAIYYPAGAGLCRWGFTGWQPILYYGGCPYLATRQGSRLDSFSSTSQTEPNGHPCPKPLSVMKWIVARASLEGETLLDPFAGSCRTLLAAKLLGRKAIGIELDERWCEIGARSLAQDALFDSLPFEEAR